MRIFLLVYLEMPDFIAIFAIKNNKKDEKKE